MRILHLSDLHFGRDRPELLVPLRRSINDLAPDMVAISGDLTQRARSEQFREAKAFIDSLEPPVLAVPGNHDTPLYNLVERALMPWRKYRKWIARDLEPQIHTARASVVGVNSVNPLSWQRGWFDSEDIDRVRRGFAETPPDALRIVVVHHPLEHLPGEPKKLMRGASEAIRALGACGVDIVLSGHLHSWRAEPFAETHDHPAVLQVHAGTGLSNRVRGEPNDFNLLNLDNGSVSVDRYAADAAVDGFALMQSAQFRREDAGWRPI